MELGDHFVDRVDPPAPWFEAWTTLAALEADPDSIRLTTGVTRFPLGNPSVLAHQAITVDHISGGRLELGLGTGVLMPRCRNSRPGRRGRTRPAYWSGAILRRSVSLLDAEARVGGGAIRY